ncbi:MAG: HEAT repeat domain-containing protein [Planctomycetes bacterium]|nr:HEAT repeat domain-containing protein [Planctomycetota bacterium]
MTRRSRLAVVLAAAFVCWALPGQAEEPKTDASAEETKAKVEAFKKAVADKDEGKRTEAVRGLAGCRHPQVFAMLGRCLQTDTDGVRIAAAETLGEFQDVRCTPILGAALPANKGSDDVSEALYKALGQAHDPRAVPEIMKLLLSRGMRFDIKKDKSGESTLPVWAAIAALGKIKHPDSVEALVKYGSGIASQLEVLPEATSGIAEQYLERTQQAMLEALGLEPSDIPGSEMEDYAKWWRRNRGKAFAPKK